MPHALPPGAVDSVGIRIAEGVPTNDLADDGVYEFVFCFNPLPARGAISSNTPPLALGQPTKHE